MGCRKADVHVKVVGAIVIMEKPPGEPRPQTEYHVLETLRTSTLGKEINQAAAEGYRPIGLFNLLNNYYGLLERTVGDPRQTAEQAADSGSSPRYKLVAARSLGTVEKELKRAAAAGYRALMSTSSGPSASMFPGQGMELIVLLEKTDTSGYDYVVVGSNDPSDLRQKLQQAAAKGFQLMPQTLVRKTGMTAMLTLLMEKRPGALGAPCCYDYEVVSVSAKDPAGAQKEITLAAEKGLRPFGLWWKPGWTGEEIIILEKAPPQTTTDQ